MSSGTDRCIALLRLVFVIAMITAAQPAMSRTAPAPATERILDDSGGRIGGYLIRYEALRKSSQRVVIDGTCASACTLLLGVIALCDAARGACLPCRVGSKLDGRSDQQTGDKISMVALSDRRASVDRAARRIAVGAYLSGRA
jgi:hypothetical protein